jgi:hypothetical protein
MLCSLAESGRQIELGVAHAETPAARHWMDSASGAVDTASPTHDHALAHHDHAAAHSDHGSSCSTLCSLTPLASTALMVVAPVQLTQAEFPSPPAPEVSFLSDGQERPPRGI